MLDPDNKKVTFVKKQVYNEEPHMVSDNHFSGTAMSDLEGGKGFAGTRTLRRDRFPKNLKQFMHHEKVSPGDGRAKAHRYENPILAVKHFEATPTTKAYTRCIVSFQSTGATNIEMTNSLPSLTLYVKTKSRGKGANKRDWGIEMNEGRDTYLGFYYGIDNIDHMLKNAGVKFISWKYWHAPFLHFLGMAVTSGMFESALAVIYHTN